MFDRLEQLARGGVAGSGDDAVVRPAQDPRIGVEAQAVFVTMRAMAVVAVVREDGPHVFFKKLDLIRGEDFWRLGGHGEGAVKWRGAARRNALKTWELAGGGKIMAETRREYSTKSNLFQGTGCGRVAGTMGLCRQSKDRRLAQ